ncbi:MULTISPECIES: universal stress protein [unclassified Epibacterium]|jgi:nucleotide-binding universal stress UspA family protein|uniref:universal stress protein n=1 Tax=unclassified Epibacterium TaxID=2639179 RepID=UPI001EF3F30C|nr:MULTISPECIES: universal stress protein [unclassified Epibacterium]MCG7621889.1 universal stress protein [Epibacterium sp. Ofav1-8]MCG7627122.1 universal stress protein [Epibacterium sp. MM17-32]
MTYKTILTVRSTPDGNATALEQAEAMVRRADGHLDVLCLGVDRTRVGYYDGGANAIAINTMLERARDEVKATETAVAARLKSSDVAHAIFTAIAPLGDISRVTAHHARFSDLVVMQLPYGDGQGPEVEPIVEAALFDARTPVLVVPDGGEIAPAPKTVLVAWDESIEALVAVRKALPFLQAADTVRIAVIDPPKHGIERSDPGGMLCQMLARHGVACEIDVLSKTLPRVSDVLSRHATDTGAEMIVMGAYGHSRFRESILGGTTRNMLEHAEVPVLMAH